MTNVGWYFDPTPPSGSIMGGTPELYVFRPSLDTFVREILQNSHDQRVGDAPVDVEFTFESMHGPRKDEFVEALAWDTLEPHIAGAADDEGTLGLRLTSALAEIEDEPLLICRISDGNTRGLVGGEDERRANFAALCRNVLDTAEKGSLGRGGSYGLGKAVLWLYSSLSTVLFSSTIDVDDQHEFRLFGRTVLPYHETHPGTRKWNGSGWFGASDTVGGHERAVSMWGADAEARARPLGMWRPSDWGSGTSIAVLGFREPQRDEPRRAEEIAKDVLVSASRWFWPSICRNEPSLRVTARAVENGSEVFSDEATLTSEVANFHRALTGTDAQPTASQPGSLAESTVRFEVPEPRQRSVTDSAHLTSDFKLRLTRSAEPDAEADHANKVALIRGAGMVVKYASIGKTPADGRPYFAVLLAGIANRSNTPSDEESEMFLRAAEPPAHDDWLLTDAVKARYKPGGGARIQELWPRIRTAIGEMCEDHVPPSAVGPPLLANFFPLGKSGRPSPGRPSFNVTFGDTAFQDGQWTVEGRVRRTSGEGVWKVAGRLFRDAETGRGEQLPLEHAEAWVEGGEATVRRTDRETIIDVPAAADSVSFRLRSIRASGALLDELTRTRLRVDVQPRATVTGGSRS